jgi:hypothetical protein
MKKVCLVFLFILLTLSTNAFAKSEYIRIECNNTLGLFDISYNKLSSSKLEQYFQSNPNNVYRYDIEDTSNKTEIFLINRNQIFKIRNKEPFSLQYQLDFNYTCNLKNSYNLNISFNNYDIETDTSSYNIFIKKDFYDDVSKQYISTPQIENIIIGDNSNIQQIIIAESEDAINPDISFETIDAKNILSYNSTSTPSNKEIDL